MTISSLPFQSPSSDPYAITDISIDTDAQGNIVTLNPSITYTLTISVTPTPNFKTPKLDSWSTISGAKVSSPNISDTYTGGYVPAMLSCLDQIKIYINIPKGSPNMALKAGFSISDQSDDASVSFELSVKIVR